MLPDVPPRLSIDLSFHPPAPEEQRDADNRRHAADEDGADSETESIRSVGPLSSTKGRQDRCSQEEYRAATTEHGDQTPDCHQEAREKSPNGATVTHRFDIARSEAGPSVPAHPALCPCASAALPAARVGKMYW
jgi:hypothetical protein